MIIKTTFISILIMGLPLLGCGSGEADQIKNESPKIDSLIRVTDVNDCTIVVKFGYDAIGAIKTSAGIVIIDGGITTFLTEKYKKFAENKFNQNNYIYVINTHGHHDHVRGNSLFPSARIAGHENCRIDTYEGRSNYDSLLFRLKNIVDDYDNKLQNSTPETAEWDDNFTQKIRYLGSFIDSKRNTPFRLPEITFSDSMKLECGDASFEMFYFGKFHSNSDILVYCPENKVLFTGDLFSKYGRPNMSNRLSETDKNRWFQAIKWIRKRTDNIETVIDGHGQILTIDDLKSFDKNVLDRYYNSGNYQIR